MKTVFLNAALVSLVAFPLPANAESTPVLKSCNVISNLKNLKVKDLDFTNAKFGSRFKKDQLASNGCRNEIDDTKTHLACQICQEQAEAKAGKAKPNSRNELHLENEPTGGAVRLYFPTGSGEQYLRCVDRSAQDGTPDEAFQAILNFPADKFCEGIKKILGIDLQLAEQKIQSAERQIDLHGGARKLQQEERPR